MQRAFCHYMKDSICILVEVRVCDSSLSKELSLLQRQSSGILKSVK